MKNRKICIIAAYPPQKGGIASYVRDLTKKLSKRNGIVLITYGKLGRKSTKRIKIIEIAVPKTKFFRGFFFIIRALKKLFEVYRLEGIKIFHAHYLHPCGTVAVLFKMFFRKKCKVIITLHGSDVARFLKIPLLNYFFKLILKNADHITTVSNFLKKSVENEIRKEILLTPPGIPESFTFKKPKRIKKEKIISYFGALERYKGIETFISLAKSFQKMKSVKFLVVGNGSKKHLVIKASKKLKNIVYRSSVKREKIFSYILASDVVVVPSKREALGLVALEASALKKPVIAFEVGGVREVLSDIALARNEKELKNLLRKVITSEKFKEKLVKENSKKLKNFSWKKTVRTLEKIYYS